MDELRFSASSGIAVPAPLHPVADFHRDKPDCDNLTGDGDRRHLFPDLVITLQDDVLHCLGRSPDDLVRFP